MEQSFIWGVDLGGTKIEAVVIDTQDDFNIIARERIATQAHLGYEVVLNNIKHLLDTVSKKHNIPYHRIGIGTPGSINPHTGKLRNCNSIYLNGRSFHKDLESKIGASVRISNDANCFAISEYKMGIIRDVIPDARVVVGVIMGTGVGSGVVVDGKIINGKNGIGGEWGHNFLDESGGQCYCGRMGCVETVISGPALERFYFKNSGEKQNLKNIVEAYRLGHNKIAVKTMDRLFHFFSLAISNIINVIDPDAIVIGGGLGNIDELYTEVLEKLPQFVFSDYVETKFLKPKLGDSSGVFGAALLW